MRFRPFGMILILILLTPVAYAREDLRIESAFRGLSIGTYGKTVPVAIGTVTDQRSVPDPKFLGTGWQGTFKMFSQDPPDKYVRDALEQTLQSIGLAAKEGETPAVIVHADIWRARLQALQTTGRVRMRSEIQVRFTLTNAAKQPLGSFSVVGNAEIKGQIGTKERLKTTFQEAIYDTMEKFAGSQTLAKALGPDVVASFRKSETPRTTKYQASDIDTTKFYGPTELVGKLPKIDLTKYDVLELRPFKMADPGFKGDVAETERMVPSLIIDRIGGSYPGLFQSVVFGEKTLGSSTRSAKRLVVEGDLPAVWVGSAMKRMLIGFGAGQVRLEMNIRLLDGESGQELTKFEMFSRNWGAAWQAKEGSLEDMADRMAADFVYYLVSQHKQDYKNEEEAVR